ncbi:hypothetical protein BOX15_Mlig020725g1, partial [Macrostomum lignano]
FKPSATLQLPNCEFFQLEDSISLDLQTEVMLRFLMLLVALILVGATQQAQADSCSCEDNKWLCKTKSGRFCGICLGQGGCYD